MKIRTRAIAGSEEIRRRTEGIIRNGVKFDRIKHKLECESLGLKPEAKKWRGGSGIFV